MVTIYVGVDGNYIDNNKLWDKNPHIRDACRMIREVTHAKDVSFVCNFFGKIFDGDVYQVGLYDDDCELFYLLRTGFAKLDSEKVRYYLHKKSAP